MIDIDFFTFFVTSKRSFLQSCCIYVIWQQQIGFLMYVCIYIFWDKNQIMDKSEKGKASDDFVLQVNSSFYVLQVNSSL